MQLRQKSKCVVIADIGAVNTVSAINKQGEYLGCAIFPGIQMSLDALHGETAQLPNVNVSKAVTAIGKNSYAAISSGVLLGTVLSIDGFVEKFAQEMRCEIEALQLIATGEFASSAIKMSKYRFEYEEELTLKGLYYIYRNTSKQ